MTYGRILHPKRKDLIYTNAFLVMIDRIYIGDSIYMQICNFFHCVLIALSSTLYDRSSIN
jgi:hypothetical protein